MREQERSTQSSRGQSSQGQASEGQASRDQGSSKSQTQGRQGASGSQGSGSISPIQVEKFIKGIEFPCDKEDLIDCATANHAPADVLDLIEEFPEQEFNSPVDVARCFSQVQH